MTRESCHNSWPSDQGALQLLYDIDRTYDVNAPIGFAITGSGDRWYSYWDKANGAMRVDHFQTESGGGGGGGGEDPGEILNALAMKSGNPIQIGGKLMLALRVARPTSLKLSLYDIAGRLTARRPESRVLAGEHRLEWRPTGVQPGIYFLRLEVEGKAVMSRRITFLR